MLTPEEQQIIDIGRQNGKSSAEVVGALSKYRRELQTTTPTKSIREKFSFKAIPEAVVNFIGARPIADTFGTEIAALRANSPQETSIIRSEAPTLKETVGSAIETGSMLIPGAAGSKLATKALVGAGTGYGIGVGQSLQHDESVIDAATPGIETAVGAVFPVLGSVIGLAPKALEKANLRLTPVEQQNLIKRGKDIAGYLAEKKVVGTPQQRLAKLNDLYHAMEDRVQKEIAKAGVALPKDQIIDRVKTIRSQFENDPLILPEVDRAVEQFTDFINSKKNTFAIPLSDINDFKRNIMERAFSKNKTDVVNEARYAVGTALKDMLIEDVKPLNKLNAEYSDIITARGLLRKAATRNQTGLLTRALATGVGAAAGGSVGGFFGAAIGGATAERLTNTLATPIRSATGASIQTIGDVLKRVPVDEQGNVSLKILLQILAGEEQEDAE